MARTSFTATRETEACFACWSQEFTRQQLHLDILLLENYPRVAVYSRGILAQWVVQEAWKNTFIYCHL
jgi:hypothetical protein